MKKKYTQEEEYRFTGCPGKAQPTRVKYPGEFKIQISREQLRTADQNYGPWKEASQYTRVRDSPLMECLSVWEERKRPVHSESDTEWVRVYRAMTAQQMNRGVNLEGINSTEAEATEKCGFGCSYCAMRFGSVADAREHVIGMHSCTVRTNHGASERERSSSNSSGLSGGPYNG